MRRGLACATGALGLAAALGAGAAAAADAGVGGTWSITGRIEAAGALAVAQPVCTFQQQGAAVSGSCEGPNSKGPVSGSVAGQHVTLQWRHTPKTDPGLAGVSTFDGELGADGTIAGAWTYDGLPDAKGTFKAVRK